MPDTGKTQYKPEYNIDSITLLQVDCYYGADSAQNSEFYSGVAYKWLLQLHFSGKFALTEKSQLWILLQQSFLSHVKRFIDIRVVDVLSDNETRQLYDKEGLNMTDTQHNDSTSRARDAWDEFKPFIRQNKHTRARASTEDANPDGPNLEQEPEDQARTAVSTSLPT